MASSVSSERAFSSAGITISKRRNRLKDDIVEALQILKCFYQNDLIFREVLTSTEEEMDMELEPTLDVDIGEQEDDREEFSWDQLLEEEDEDDENSIYVA
jgi:hypothetical protein